MKLVKAIWILMAAMLLASCGGSSGAGDSPFNPGGGETDVADLVITLSQSQITNTGSDDVTVTVTAIDAQRNALATVPVKVSADSDAIVVSDGTDTDETGKLVSTLSIGANKSNRVITVTAVSGTVTKSVTIQVTGTAVSMVLNPAVIAPSASANVQIRVVDAAGNAMAGETVTVTAAGLTPAEATGTTDGNGAYVFAYTSPATTGDYTVTVNAAGGSDSQVLQVQTVGTRPVVTAAITSASVAADPSVVAVNLPDSSSNRSEIRALFVGADNKPIPNVRVRFDLGGDPNNVGGTFTAGGGTQPLYSNENGVVTTAYVPGTRSSPTDGVVIRACYGVSDNDPDLATCANSATKTLTVTSEALNVTIGTNAVIIVGELTYTKQLNVSVVDASGAAKADVNLVASVDLPYFRKGSYALGLNGWGKVSQIICPNEDVNRNGVLESGEDANGNGTLEPRKADVRIRLLSSKTDSTGSAILEVTYDQDHGSWLDAVVTVSASGISGTEGRATYALTPVPVDAAQIRNTSSSPAFLDSPYGVALDCANPN
ncbi:MAG: hypothetical protein QM722_24345 [Piscinibacter sp.]